MQCPVTPISLPAQDLIVFDGTCVFCSGFARFMARHDHRQTFRFVTAHSPLGRALYLAHGLDPDLMATNIVLTDGQAHVKMAAFAAAMRKLPWPWRALAILGSVPKSLADPVYDLIARNRYRFGRQACLPPSPALKARLIE
ncbi:MAG: DUF393 domain-containing protein [Rhodobacterales bacterium]|nr:MAG: DUF393 domain-containing protein [Rhodobacterales bacterium]